MKQLLTYATTLCLLTALGNAYGMDVNKKKRKATSHKSFSKKPKAAKAECCYCHIPYKIGPDLTAHQRTCVINKITCRFCPMRCRKGAAIKKHEEICAIKKGIDLQLLVPEALDNPEENYPINFGEPFHFYIPVEPLKLPVPPALDALNESLSMPDDFNGESV